MSKEIKDYFSIFKNYKEEYKNDLIYFDSASSSLTPDSVIEKMSHYYYYNRSNIDRSSSNLSKKANHDFEKSRFLLARHLNCAEDEIIWTPSSTYSSNILMDLLEKNIDFFNIKEGDEILTTVMEHHSSLIPLQELAKRKKLQLKFLELNEDFDLNLENLNSLVSEKTKIVSIMLSSNVLGTINDLPEIISKIKEINQNIFFISDFTNAFSHVHIDLKQLSSYIDAAYFSMHKGFGATGVGVLFLKRDISRNLIPAIYGGGIVSNVSLEETYYRSDIKLFEPGTPNISGIISASESLNFLENISNQNINNLYKHNESLVKYFLEKIEILNETYKNYVLNKMFIKTFANKVNNTGLVSFSLFIDDLEIHPHDIVEILSSHHIAVRGGYHCAEPLIKHIKANSGLVRASFHIYNTKEEIDYFIKVLEKVRNIFSNK